MRRAVFGDSEKVRTDGKYWGYWDEATKTYVSRRRPEHYCRKYKGWGVQLSVFEMLKRQRCDRIVIDLPDGYRVSRFSDWVKYGRIDCLNPADGEQIFLHEKYFVRSAILGIESYDGGR